MLMVAIGGVIGSLLRFALSEIFPKNAIGILLANLLGVIFAAHAIVYLERKGNANFRHLLLPGFCGGLTTFSALMLATETQGIGYLIGTIVASLAIAFVSIPLARKAFGHTS